MAKQDNEQSNQLNLTVVALVALVAIVGLVALVMNAASIGISTGSQLASAAYAAQPVELTEKEIARNVAGDASTWCQMFAADCTIHKKIFGPGTCSKYTTYCGTSVR